MKRALAIAVAVCTFGALGFSQIALSGKMTSDICILPTLSVSGELTLTYSVAGIDITSITGFAASGLSSQKFTMKGVFGPFSITGSMLFDVAAVLYDESVLETGFDFGGIGLALKVEHWAFPPNTIPVWCPGLDGGAALRYTLTGTLAPITAKLVFIDCCTGTAFYNLNVTLKGLGLCCGITYNVEFDFLKTGFSYLKFTGINVPLCCGVSFDVAVKYTTTAKELTITPKFAGIAEGCFTLYADAVWTGNTWTGIEVYGFKIGCTIADCNFINFVTFMNPAKAAAAHGFLTACGEWEYVEMGFCGAGCCGGKYVVNMKIYFGTGGGLFDVTRVVYDVSIPVMANFTFNVKGTLPAATCVAPSLCLGWTFTF